MSKRALILGVNGQDGSYLADILLEKGYDVHGLVRRSSVDNLWRVRHVLDRITLHRGDICDQVCIANLIDTIAPDEVYNEADQDSVGWSQATPCAQLDVTAKSVAGILEVLRYMGGVRFFQPVSATMFGHSPPPQDERTPFDPQSPYACAKAAAYYLCRHYRRTYGMFVSTAILFNHDSPRRGPDYLLQRIARGVPLWGDLSEVVDIGYAREYMDAAWRIMQLSESGDFVLGTGKGYRIADLRNEQTPRPVATPSAGLVACTRKARAAIGWQPEYDAASTLEMIRCELGLSATPRHAASGTSPATSTATVS